MSQVIFDVSDFPNNPNSLFSMLQKNMQSTSQISITKSNTHNYNLLQWLKFLDLPKKKQRYTITTAPVDFLTGMTIFESELTNSLRDDLTLAAFLIKYTMGELLYHQDCFPHYSITDRNLMKVAIKYCRRKDNIMKKLASKELKQDRELMLMAVKKNGLTILHGKHTDRSIIMSAIKQNGCAIKGCPVALLDLELISIALTQNPKAILYIRNYLSDNYKNEPIVQKAVRAYLHKQHICQPVNWDRGVVFGALEVRSELRRLFDIPSNQVNEKDLYWKKMKNIQ